MSKRIKRDALEYPTREKGRTIPKEYKGKYKGSPYATSKDKKQLAEFKYEKYFDKMRRILGNTTTYDSDLRRTAKRLFGKRFMGVYAANRIPQSIGKGKLLIINLDDADEPGSHWIGAAKDNQNTIWVYDSFGRNIHRILPSIYTSKRKIRSTERDAEQTAKEQNCGARVVAWLQVFAKYGAEYAKWI